MIAGLSVMAEAVGRLLKSVSGKGEGIRHKGELFVWSKFAGSPLSLLPCPLIAGVFHQPVGDYIRTGTVHPIRLSARARWFRQNATAAARQILASAFSSFRIG